MNDSLLTLYQQTFIEYLLKTLIIGTEMGLKKSQKCALITRTNPNTGCKIKEK